MELAATRDARFWCGVVSLVVETAIAKTAIADSGSNAVLSRCP